MTRAENSVNVPRTSEFQDKARSIEIKNIVSLSLTDDAVQKLDNVAHYLQIPRSAAARILINNGYRTMAGIVDFKREESEGFTDGET